ncbi:MAG: glycosyltransferase [Acidimicrobiia bacterium]|nr:glycosyltransferase [Acidimicrobiia bacterium]
MRLVSIVMPVLDDRDAARRLLAQISPDSDVDILVVDGGADPSLEDAARAHPCARYLRARPGRAAQMNAGAEVATGEWLLFLHADSELPPGWTGAVAALRTPIIGGWFQFALDDAAWQARAIERMVGWRVRWLRLPYGDQGLIVRRDAFRALGGFRDLPLMEDVEFVRRLIRAGEVGEVPLPLRTSARRWRRDGWFRRSTRNTVLVALYLLGVPPARLATWYHRRR